MNKNILPFLLLLLLWTCKKEKKNEPNIIYILDANFKKCLIQDNYVNTNGDNEIQIAEAEAVTNLYVRCDNIKDLTGIEKFTNVTDIDIAYCYELTTLDLHANTKIRTLNLDYTGVTALNVSSCTELKILNCQRNELTSLDLSSNIKLTELSCFYNNLTTLDLHTNTSLVKAWCSSNNLTKLNITGDTALCILYCSFNQLISFDLSTNIKLIDLDCTYNQLTSLDVRANSALTALNCGGNLNLPFVCLTHAQFLLTPFSTDWTKDDTCLWKENC